jgi:hypothetical protein
LSADGASATFLLFVTPVLARLFVTLMPNEPDNGEPETPHPATGYRISNGPVVRLGRSDPSLPSDLAEVVELPRVYGEPLVFAIARDPRTLFVYWIVDWSTIFEHTAPVDRQVHLRVYRENGDEEASEAVEPLAGNYYLTISDPRDKYRVEIGYYRPREVWNSVATSELVTMPPERVAERTDVDLATIPFHLSFQRLIDLFRCSNSNALSEIVSRLQQSGRLGGFAGNECIAGRDRHRAPRIWKSRKWRRSSTPSRSVARVWRD